MPSALLASTATTVASVPADRLSFLGHQSFACRHLWLKRGMRLFLSLARAHVIPCAGNATPAFANRLFPLNVHAALSRIAPSSTGDGARWYGNGHIVDHAVRGKLPPGSGAAASYR